MKPAHKPQITAFEMPDPLIQERLNKIKEEICGDVKKTPIPSPPPKRETILKNQRDILHDLKLRADRYQYETMQL
jgi:hypothetical protein